MKWREKWHFEKKVMELTQICEEYLKKEGNIFEEIPSTEKLMTLAFLLVKLALRKEDEFVKRIRLAVPSDVKDLVEKDLKGYEERARKMKRILKGFLTDFRKTG